MAAQHLWGNKKCFHTAQRRAPLKEAQEITRKRAGAPKKGTLSQIALGARKIDPTKGRLAGDRRMHFEAMEMTLRKAAKRDRDGNASKSANFLLGKLCRQRKQYAPYGLGAPFETPTLDRLGNSGFPSRPLFFAQSMDSGPHKVGSAVASARNVRRQLRRCRIHSGATRRQQQRAPGSLRGIGASFASDAGTVDAPTCPRYLRPKSYGCPGVLVRKDGDVNLETVLLDRVGVSRNPGIPFCFSPKSSSSINFSLFW